MAVLGERIDLNSPRPWHARLLRPSLTDAVFLLILFWLFLSASDGWQALLRDGDTGMHARTGDWIRMHGQVPRQDIYSYTKPAGEWFAFEWLACLLLSWANSAFGLKGIVLLCGGVLALWLTVMFQDMVSRGSDGLGALLLALLCGNAAAIHFHARPHVFTLLLLALLVATISRDRRKQDRWVWVLVPLSAVWTNLHAGFVVEFVYLGAVAGGLLVEERIIGSPRPWRRYLLVAAGCAAASLVNPYALRLHQHVVGFAQGSFAKNFVDEYKSPQFRSEEMMWFLGLLMLSLAVSGRLVSRARIADALVIWGFAAMSLISARHIPLFLTAAAPVLAVELSELWRRFAEGKPRDSVPGTFHSMGSAICAGARGVSLWTLAMVVAVGGLWSNWPHDFDRKFFPVELIRRHEAALAQNRTFTTDQWGDYLLFRSFPRQRVFMDGRSDFYGETVAREYLRIFQGDERWSGLLDKYEVEYILAPTSTALATLARGSAGWELVDGDAQAVLFKRRQR